MIVNKLAPAPPTAPAEAPTRVRYGVLAFLCALSFVLYLDRICISKAAPKMEGDLHLSHTMMGFVFGAFTIAYGLFEIPTGRWGDRYGSRGVLLRIVLWWSAFTILTGGIWPFRWDSGSSLHVHMPWVDAVVPLVFDSFLFLLLVRFLFGAGEAGAIPNMARVTARWFPAYARGTAQGLINSSMLIGGAVAPIAAAYLIKGVGWRLSFFYFGMLGVVWAAAFFLWFRDSPADHPAVNEAERKLIAEGGGLGELPADHPPVPWGRVLRNDNVWLLGGIITCSAFVTYMYWFWYPTYLEKARGVSATDAGWLASIVLTGGAVGCTLGGYVGDWLVRRTGSRRWSRRLLGFAGQFFAAVMLVVSIHCDSPVMGSLAIALGYCGSSITLSNWWAVVTDISGKHVGALFGLMNSLGVPGAFVSPLFYGYYADWMARHGFKGRAQWDPGFYVYAAALALAALGWLLVNPGKSLVDEPGPPLTSAPSA